MAAPTGYEAPQAAPAGCELPLAAPANCESLLAAQADFANAVVMTLARSQKTGIASKTNCLK